MRAFIIRPFGTKAGIDFDKVDAELIAPALERLKLEGGTTGKVIEAGNIREDMFQLLLVSDIVVADISIDNVNAVLRAWCAPRAEGEAHVPDSRDRHGH